MPRRSAARRGYGERWRRESAAFLALPENRLCACRCGKPSEVVDHITPHKGDPRLFWSKRNWRGMAKACHDRKTAKGDGGFGRPVRAVDIRPVGCDAAGYPIDPAHPWSRRRPAATG